MSKNTRIEFNWWRTRTGLARFKTHVDSLCVSNQSKCLSLIRGHLRAFVVDSWLLVFLFFCSHPITRVIHTHTMWNSQYFKRKSFNRCTRCMAVDIRHAFIIEIDLINFVRTVEHRKQIVTIQSHIQTLCGNYTANVE